MSLAAREPAVVRLPINPVTAEEFAPYGVVLRTLDDGTPVTREEAQLDLSQGAPRFYLMRIEARPVDFHQLTRHRRTTQTLMSIGGGSWILVVAPPSDIENPDSRPSVDHVKAFLIPGDTAVTMFRGCWHSGPYFTEPEMSFVNLELADTNQVDHQTYRIADELSLRFELVPGESLSPSFRDVEVEQR